jgi:hypothetical protein
MEKLFAALIPVLCVVAFGPLFSAKMGAVADRKSARKVPEGGSRSAKVPLCEVTR